MNRLFALFIIAIIVSPNLSIVRGQTLTLVPFDVEYEPGGDISISGTSSASANLTLVVVFNSTTLYEANFTADGDGNYSEEYKIHDNATEGVYTVTVSDAGESVDADFTVVSDNSKELAETLLEQAADAKDNVEDEFDDLEDKVPSDANSSYLQGVQYLSSAQELFDDGNYTGAASMAFESIQLFGDAFELVQGVTAEPVDDVKDDDGEGETGDPDSLAVAIERAYAYWMKLNRTVTRLDEDGFNVTRIIEALEDVKGHLDMASVYQGEGNHTAAVREFREARKSLGRIHGFIESKVKERKEKQTEQFLMQFERRVDKITGVLEGLQVSLEAGKIQRVQAVLRSTAQRLLRLSDSLEGGDLEGVLDEMEDAVDEIENGLDELNGDGLSRQIKSANRFEAKIESLNNSLQRLTNAGYNTTELDEYLNDAKNLLAQIEEKLHDGDEGEAKELIEEAEELIEEAQELFKKLQINSLRATWVTGNVVSGDDDGDDDEEDHITASSETGSNEITGELRELLGTISQIKERLVNISTNGVNTTDVKNLIVDAEAIIEKAMDLAEENPDEAKELTEMVEELLDEAMDLLEEITGTESNVSLAAFEPDDGDDDDEKDEDGEDSTLSELPEEEPDDVEING
jgi:hypothetical protein